MTCHLNTKKCAGPVRRFFIYYWTIPGGIHKYVCAYHFDRIDHQVANVAFNVDPS